MATSIYRVGTDIFDASTKQRITGDQWNSGAYKGATEVSAPKTSLQETLQAKQTALKNNVLSSQTLNNGLISGNPASQLPSSNTQAQQIYSENKMNDAGNSMVDLNKQLNDIKAQQLREAESQRKQAETDLKTIQDQKQGEIDTYDSQMNPLAEQARTQYKTMLDSIAGVDYKALVESKVSLTNDIIAYSKLMRDELDQEASKPSLASVKQGRQNAVKENYTSKIATSEAAMNAIDGNFTLAFDIMDKGANAINQLTTDRINFLNMVKGIFDQKESDANTKVLNLTSEEKDLINNAITDLEAKIKNVEENKAEIMKLMETNPLIAKNAGLLLTDTPEQRATKLQDFYVKNPQYTPENQEYIKKMREKYFDAGITMNDSIATVQSKIKNSATYQRENADKSPSVERIGTDANGDPIYGTYDKATDSYKPITTGDKSIISPSGNAYDLSTYATDPKHAQSVQNIINNIGKFNSIADIDAYIKSVQPNSRFTGQMIADVANANGIGWEELVALTQLESFLGTSNVANNNNNPGGVTWNTNFPASLKGTARPANEGGNYVKYATMQEGLDAVAKQLARRKVDLSTTTPATKKTQAEIAFEASQKEKEDKVNSIKQEQAKQSAFLSGLASEILTDEGKNSAVGNNPFARGKVPVPLPFGLGFEIPYGADHYSGANQNFIGKVQQLVDNITLAKLIEVKGQGATFGALSDSEREVLERAATPINQWVVKDESGKVVGYKIDQKSFDKEIKRIQELYSNNSVPVISLEQTIKNNPELVAEYDAIVSANPNLTDEEILQVLGQ
jgi:hypothetical protein